MGPLQVQVHGNTPRTNSPLSSEPSNENAGANTTRTLNVNQRTTNRKNIKNTPSTGRGIWKLTTKYGGKALKGMVKGSARVAGAATLGTIGLAAGIATGDLDKAFSGAMVGLSAGSSLGGRLVDGAGNLVNGAKSGFGGIKDAFNEGKYGKEEAARMKFDQEFKNTSEYKKLISKYPGNENTVQEFLNAGITDTKKMEKAISKGFDTKKAIAYMKMAEKCPDKILYDDNKFIVYLENYGIDEQHAQEIRNELINFK